MKGDTTILLGLGFHEQILLIARVLIA